MEKTEESFFAKLFSSLFASSDPDFKKKKQLKNIAKILSKSRYKYYKNDEILPSFAKLFYDIYKAVSPAQLMFNAMENPSILKFMVINYSLSDEQHEIIKELSKDYIIEKSKTTPIDSLTADTKQLLTNFLSAFDSEKISKIEGTYNKILLFKNFCTFDFYFLLKKFDSHLKERDFSLPPHFDKINAEYLTDDLKDFLCVAIPISEISDWSDMMSMFKEVKGQEPLNPNLWNKIVIKIRSILTSKTFDMMLQLMTKNPEYHFDFTNSEELIIDSYLDKIKQETEATLAGLATQQQNSKISSLVTQLFETTDIIRLKNYTPQLSATYERKSLGRFTYAEPLNYYKSFLLDYIKKDLREFCTLVLIRGAWSSNTLSAPMSNAYNALLETSDALVLFDEKIAEEGEIGTKLKTHLPRVERDKDAKSIIGTIINDLNTEARNFCVEATKDLVTIAKTIKSLMEDYAKQKGELIVNWKELDKFSEKPIKQMAVSIYQKIYLFVTLMQNCLSSK